MAKEEKVQQVEKIAAGLKESPAVIFANYEGLSMAEMTALRKKLSQLGAELKVAKNTLVR
ncbi:50S ribosomal protein L10, partial [Candidatus Saccharibacteria bacterium]|nr:50S ribosomal protein L10 [Candidatus Saccharibacteria bacterium]